MILHTSNSQGGQIVAIKWLQSIKGGQTEGITEKIAY